MRHRLFGNQLGRNTKQARALYRGLVAEVLEHGKIETTLAKAKAIRGLVDKVITQAKKSTPEAKRNVIKIMGGNQILKKVFEDLAPKYTSRNGGFTRIIRMGQRFSDTAEKVILELVEGIEKKIETVSRQPAETATQPNQIKTAVKESKKITRKTPKTTKKKTK